MSGDPLPRATHSRAPDGLRSCDEQLGIPPHVLEIEGHALVVNHANYCSVGQVAGDVGTRIALVVADFDIGRALLWTPPPEAAREIAAALVKTADDCEAEAARLTAAALDQARRP